MGTLKKIVMPHPAGDPRNPSTWSGTPANIIKALEAADIGVDSFQIKIHPLKARLIQMIHRGSGLGDDFQRGLMYRSAIANSVQNQARSLKASSILHTTTYTLPYSNPNTDIANYLYCDYTWNLVEKNTPNISEYPPRMRKAAEDVERKAYSQIEHFFPISEFVKDNLVSHYGISPKKITVAGTGLGQIQPFHGTKDYKNGPILMVACQRFEDKGGPLLIEAFKLALEKQPDLRLIIVGNERYRHLVNDVPNITITGYLSNQQLQVLFEEARLFAMPAVCEPWGLVYLEALACKMPVLGLKRNSLPEITQHGRFGYLAEGTSALQLAEVLLEALTDHQRLETKGIAGQAACLGNFSWERTAKIIKGVIFQ